MIGDRALPFSLLAAVSAAIARAQSQVKRPNIVLILAGDMGRADISSFGGEIKMPNLDSLRRAQRTVGIDGVMWRSHERAARCEGSARAAPSSPTA